jgi:predicted dinucleotide-binding enzyme
LVVRVLLSSLTRKCCLQSPVAANAAASVAAAAAWGSCAGVMGVATAKALQSLGYKVSGWSRTQPSQQQQQERAGISSCFGQQHLQQFVEQQDVLVCLLPLTQETTGVHVLRSAVGYHQLVLHVLPG